MLSKTQIKLIRSLQLKKYREEEGLFIAEGKKIVEELVNSEIEIEEIFSTEEIKAKAPIVKITQEELEKISALTTPQGILAVCLIPGITEVRPDLKK